uniref:Uncharacterized protein n=1 Tax=Medinilla magnifica TaxID=1799599 RepID=A0A7D9MX16_9MYRT|nr:hypothetical protein [Medinilla magnifica]
MDILWVFSVPRPKLFKRLGEFVSILVQKQNKLRVTGSPRRGHSDTEGPEKQSNPVADLLVGDGAKSSPVPLGNSFLCSALMSGGGSRIRKSLQASTVQEVAILNSKNGNEKVFRFLICRMLANPNSSRFSSKSKWILLRQRSILLDFIHASFDHSFITTE